MAARTILVTGGNRGIGFAIVHSLAQKSPTDTLLLTARTQLSIDAAIKDLRDRGITNKLDGVPLEVTDDESIASAVSTVTAKYGRLDILVNNAGYARIPAADATTSEHRAAFADVHAINVASVYSVTRAFMPLLLASSSNTNADASDNDGAVPKPKIINVSSGRASLTRSTAGQLPPTASIAYSVSKVALNSLTIELQKTYAEVAVFYAVNPGHCKTAFNGYRGARDPMEGAEVVVGLVHGDAAGKREFEFGFYETVGSKGVVERVPW